MQRRLGLLVLFACLLLLPCALSQAEGARRALVVGFDDFLSQPSTAPSSANNVVTVSEALGGGAMNLSRLTTRTGNIATVEAFEAVVAEAFEGAAAGDVSYFYISTHGVWEQGRPAGEMTLLLSDGKTETGLTAAKLREIFDRVPGTKVLLIDACRSGAMLGKGVNPPFENVFAGPDYQVLCSSGGAEESWFWAGTEDIPVPSGAGYFSGALVRGITAAGSFAADVNDDGQITLSELRDYLLATHGASTAQCYPTGSDFTVFTYDVASFSGRRRDASVEGVIFQDDVLSSLDATADLTFTVKRPVQVVYQIVMNTLQGWDFDHAQFLYDNAERYGEYGDARGFLTPGMKARSLRLTTLESGAYGYALVQLLTVENGAPVVQASRVLCVPPASGDPLLEIVTDDAFCPAAWEELELVVHHQYPCQLTVTVEDMNGDTVQRIAARQATRPQQLRPLGSTFTWDGTLRDGTAAPAGQYRIRVKAYIGSESYECLSVPVSLTSPLEGQ